MFAMAEGRSTANTSSVTDGIRTFHPPSPSQQLSSSKKSDADVDAEKIATGSKKRIMASTSACCSPPNLAKTKMKARRRKTLRRARDAIVCEEYRQGRLSSVPAVFTDHVPTAVVRLSHSIRQQHQLPSNTTNNHSIPVCPQWTPSPTTTTVATTIKGRERCLHCRGGSGEHVLVMAMAEPAVSSFSNQDRPPPLSSLPLLGQIHVPIRNLRCACRVALADRHHPSSTSFWNASPPDRSFHQRRCGEDDCCCSSSCAFVRSQSSFLRDVLRRLDSSHQPHGEAIQEKCQKLFDCLQTVLLQNNCKDNHNRQPYQRWEGWMRCLMACDAVYYQIYYAQLVAACTVASTETATRRKEIVPAAAGGSGDIFLVPHPVTHFGEWMTVDSTTTTAAASTTETHHSHNVLDQTAAASVTTNAGVRQRDGEPVSEVDTTDTAAASCWVDGVFEDNHNNALAALHHLRMSETNTLFQNWMTRFPEVATEALTLLLSSSSLNVTMLPPLRINHTKKTTAVADRHDDDDETVAPRLLSEWRDSCRDFLCHLYSYATVSNETLGTVNERLLALRNNSSNNNNDHIRVVEVGAGTGYLAHLLQTVVGWSVSAYDQAPHSENEYHAATPSFVPIQFGEASSLRIYYDDDNNTSSPSAVEQLVLLLCYPPPYDSMAYEALKNFVQSCHRGRSRTRKLSQQHPQRQRRFFLHVGEFKGLTGNGVFEAYLLDNFCKIDQWPCLTWGTDAATVTLWELVWQQKQKPKCLLLPCCHCQNKESVQRCRWLRTLHYCSRDCCAASADARRRSLARLMIELGSTTVLDFDNEQHFRKLV